MNSRFAEVARDPAALTAAILVGGLTIYSYLVWREDADRVPPPAGSSPR